MSERTDPQREAQVRKVEDGRGPQGPLADAAYGSRRLYIEVRSIPEDRLDEVFEGLVDELFRDRSPRPRK
jgi:hypothetical protein